MVVTLFGIVTEDNEVHCWNALFPMDITLLGILTEDKEEQEEKA